MQQRHRTRLIEPYTNAHPDQRRKRLTLNLPIVRDEEVVNGRAIRAGQPSATARLVFSLGRSASSSTFAQNNGTLLNVFRWRHLRLKTWTIIWWFLFAGLLVLGCSVNYSDGYDLRDGAVRVSATVTAVNHGRFTTWDLRFTDQDGRPHDVGRTENLRGSPKVGDHVEIYYSPNDPTNSDMATDVRFGSPGSYQLSVARNLGLFALVPLAIGFYGLVIRMRDKREQERMRTAAYERAADHMT